MTVFNEYAYQQTEPSECGLACLAACAAILGDQTDLATLRRRFPISRGLTLKNLHEIAATMGLAARSVRCEVDELSQLRCPSILHFGLKHFVVLERTRGTDAYIFDPAIGRRRVSGRELSAQFTGVATEITATPSFQKRRQAAPLPIASLFKWTPQLLGGLAQIFILSIVLELYVLISPYYIQLAVDEAASKGDSALLISLAFGFGAFAAFNVFATSLRSIVLQKVGALLNWEMTQGTFHHLIRLPLPWFQRRRLSDVLARFQSLDPVKSLIGNGLIGAVLDGILSLATCLMMFLYSPFLAFIVLGSLFIYIAVRMIGIPIVRNLASKALAASIAEQGKRIETLRAIQTIKVMGAETQRQADWANKFADTIRTTQSTALANITFSTIHDFVGSCTNIAVIGVGAYQVINGHLTIGMLYAFTAYQSQFLTRSSNFFEQIISWRMLDLYMFRLSDIALTPVELNINKTNIGLSELRGLVEFNKVSFSYSINETKIFEDLDLRVEPGEFVAIVGPSGCGKSTVLKVLIGLYPPSSGDIRIDGISIRDWGPHSLRRAIGVVMQDDELLSGTITENVTFFDEKPDLDHMWRCLEAAAIDDEVRKMPMRSDTFVGDLGSSLSGGQRQRILIARALYKNPKMIVLDEATSHLDVDRELQINKTLRGLDITRVVVAHRPQTIALADRVISLAPG